MKAENELQLLRLAVARGLVRWEDLEEVAERVSSGGGGERAAGGAWLRVLLEDGKLEPGAVDELAAEIEEENRVPGVDAASDGAAAEPTLDQRPRAGRSDGPTFPGGGLAEGGEAELASLRDWRRYDVVSCLGTGGMGTVYKAFDPRLMRFVALKFLHRQDPEQNERFLREARAQARVDHPHVCQVFETGTGPDGRPYIAMQYLDADELSEAAADLPRDTAVRLVEQVARAVHAAHRTGLVHRDLKPGNVLVARRTLHPYVVDFGLAVDLDDPALPRPEALLGTPAYLSPEQARGGPVDRRTDVYSLGVLLYRLLAGRPPFTGSHLAETLRRVVEEEPEPLARLDRSIPHDLSVIVAKAMAKDPARRYASARALADDLGRYLEGEPIAARGPGLLYRLGKKARKHRALAAVVVAALAASAAFGTVYLDARWEARQQAELARRFGQDVQQIESDMRYAALLPLHDVRVHKDEIRRRMASLREQMATLGDLAVGPGSYALGRGHLALHEYESAYEHLDRAWRAGYREAEVASALGRVLARLDARAVLEAEAGGGARGDTGSTYRAAALAYLREAARRTPEPPHFLRGLIALYEERYDDAEAAARAARREAPWLYDSRRLEADVHLARGEAALERGRYGEARRHYDAAGAVFADLVELVRSDAAIHAADCGRWMRVMELALVAAEPAAAAREEALAACGRALRVDPDLSHAHSLVAHIHWRTAERLLARGEDPRDELERSIAAARVAVERNPRDASARANLSVAYRLLGVWAAGRGVDALEHLDRAVAAGRAAAARAPLGSPAHNTLGNALFTRARHAGRTGADPRPDLAAAAAAYERAMPDGRPWYNALVNLSNVWKEHAEYEVAQGLDPAPTLGRAIGVLEDALELNPNAPAAYNNLGNAHLTLGDFQLTRGGDPQDALERAATAYRRAIELQPDYGLAYWNLAFTERSLARHLLDRGGDPSPALARAAAALDEAERINPADSDNPLERARGALLAARWRARSGDDPTAALERAEAAVAAGLRLNPRDPTLHVTRARVAAERAEQTLAGAPDRATAEIDRGLAHCRRAIEEHPRMAEAHATTGHLHHLAARLAPDPETRATHARRAVEALERALEVNPLLESRYAPLLAAARGEIGGA